MNRTYRLVWNRTRKLVQVASECATSHGGGTAIDGTARAHGTRRRLYLACAAAWALGALALPAWSAPCPAGYTAISETGAPADGLCVKNGTVASGESGGQGVSYAPFSDTGGNDIAGGAAAAGAGGAPGDVGGLGGAGDGQGGGGGFYGTPFPGAPSIHGHGGAGHQGAYQDSPGGSGGAAAATTTGSTTTGGAGQPGADTDYAGGGGGGGAGIVVNGATTLGKNAVGGAGGAGGNASSAGFAGGGGGGGAGVLLESGHLSSSKKITGGAGGAGGSGFDPGGGGGGGDGIYITGTEGGVANGGDIVGGAGGNAASGGAFGGAGGGGGGIFATAPATITNTGSIKGGAGGTGGSRGAGGAGVTGASLTLINSGTIAGGWDGEHATRSPAIYFTSGTNRLTLKAGSTIKGRVVADGTNDTLELGGSADSHFDAGTVGSSQQYQDFEQFEKTGSSTWTLTGATSATTPWTLADGTLSVSSGSQLGHDDGDLTFNGGTLKVTGTHFTQMTRTIHWGNSGGGFDIAEGSHTFTVAQDWGNPDGSLTKTGAGTLKLTGKVETGLFDIHDGTVKVSGSGHSLKQPNYIDSVYDYVGENSGDDARLVIANGGTVSTSSRLSIGHANGASGHVRVTGANSTLDTVPAIIGRNGHGTLTVDAGGYASNVQYVGGGDTGTSGTGVLTVSGNGSEVDNYYTFIALSGDGATGEVTLSDGGMLSSTHFISMSANNPNGRADLNIGAAPTDPATAPGILDTPELALLEDNAHLNFNHTSNAYTFDTPLISKNNQAGVINQYAGTTILTADSSGFTGDTYVRGGTLAVNGKLGGPVSVDNGGTLSGHGAIGGDVTVADGGHVAPGNSAGVLDVGGDLVLGGGSIFDFELGSPGNAADPATGVSDRIDVAGDLTLDGTLKLAQSTASADGTAGFGYYRLLTYGGNLTDNGLEVGATPTLAPAGHYEVQAGGGNVDLFLAPLGDDTLQHWQGGDGTWGASNKKWLNQGSTVPVTWAGNHAVFKNQPGGFNGGTVTVSGTQSFKGLQFVDNGYRLQGSGTLQVDGSDAVDGNAEIRVLADTTATIATTIAGSDGITKTQGGVLVLAGNNRYQGGTAINGGTLSVAADHNLGATAGAITFDGGTLRNTAGLTTARSITLKSGGGTFETAADLTASGPISGNGGLTKTGAGTLTLIGANTYDGGTTIKAGTLQGDTDSLQGDITDNATLAFDQAGDGTFADVISGSGSLTKTSKGTLTLTGANTYGGGTTIKAGTLQGDTDSLQGDITDNATLVFQQDDNGAFAGAVSGHGRLAKSGHGVLVFNTANPFDGHTTVQTGVLIVGDDGHADASLGGLVDVARGATIGGFGTIGELDLSGTLSPGHSIGTLHVAGNATFHKGSTYRIEVTPDGHSDRLQVGGQVSILGGSALILTQAGDWSPRTQYSIIDAGGDISGQFASVSSSLAFLTPELDYTTHHIHLTLQRNDIDFTHVANTENQQAVASASDQLGFGDPVYDALVKLDAPSARLAFNQLSGEIHADTQRERFADSRTVRRGINRRLLDTVKPGSGGIWANVSGHWGHHDTDGNAAHLNADGSALLAGVDTTLRDSDIRLGGMLGSTQSSLSAAARHSDAHLQSTWMGVYAGSRMGAWHLRGAAAYAWTKSRSHRRVAFPGLMQTLTADNRGHAVQAYVEGSWQAAMSHGHVEPYLNLAEVQVRSGGHDEHGGSAALHVVGKRVGLGFATLGVRGAWRLGTAEHPIALHGGVGWRHAFGSTDTRATEHFVTGSPSFTVAGLPVAPNAALVNLGLRFAIGQRWHVDASYNGQLASHATDQGARMQATWTF